MKLVEDLAPGQPFTWNDGIFIKTDATKTDVLGDKYAAVVVVKEFDHNASVPNKENNVCGATIWFRSNVEVVQVDMDFYVGEDCIFRTYSE